jgi:acetyl-CoA synthetase
VDTFWQTETGGHMMTPLPGATPWCLAAARCRCPASWRPSWTKVGNDVPTVPVACWWSSALAVHDSHHLERPGAVQEELFPEEMGGAMYLAGDGAVRSADRGYFRITGRIDDVLNVSGHRMGTMEIESALVAKTDLVAEAAVVGRPDDLTGEAICAFVVLKRGCPTGDEAKAIAKEVARLGGQGDWPDCQAERTFVLGKTCPKPAPARSCAACCARSPRAKSITARYLHAGKSGYSWINWGKPKFLRG